MTPKHYSIVVLLDEESNLKMEEWVLEVENAVAKATGECSIS
jgi:hypothetical protein